MSEMISETKDMEFPEIVDPSGSVLSPFPMQKKLEQTMQGTSRLKLPVMYARNFSEEKIKALIARNFAINIVVAMIHNAVFSPSFEKNT